MLRPPHRLASPTPSVSVAQSPCCLPSAVAGLNSSRPRFSDGRPRRAEFLFVSLLSAFSAACRSLVALSLPRRTSLARSWNSPRIYAGEGASAAADAPGSVMPPSRALAPGLLPANGAYVTGLSRPDIRVALSRWEDYKRARKQQRKEG